MNSERVNPYQSPLTADEASRMSTHERSRLPLALVVLGACTYLLFTLILLTSGRNDRESGLLFCMNIPVFLVWILGLARGYRISYVAGLTAAGVQGVITGMMIAKGIGDIEIVLMVNGGITVGMGLLAGICWLFARRADVTPTSEQEAAPEAPQL